jgi:hypothetical protein
MAEKRKDRSVATQPRSRLLAGENMFLIALGVFLWCGAFFRWRWLVDPPIDKPLDLIWSQAHFKKKYGTKALVIGTYFMGAVFIFIGLLTIYPTMLDGLLPVSSRNRIYPAP